jgi:hypothetical protein
MSSVEKHRFAKQRKLEKRDEDDRRRMINTIRSTTPKPNDSIAYQDIPYLEQPIPNDFRSVFDAEQRKRNALIVCLHLRQVEVVGDESERADFAPTDRIRLTASGRRVKTNIKSAQLGPRVILVRQDDVRQVNVRLTLEVGTESERLTKGLSYILTVLLEKGEARARELDVTKAALRKRVSRFRAVVRKFGFPYEIVQSAIVIDDDCVRLDKQRLKFRLTKWKRERGITGQDPDKVHHQSGRQKLKKPRDK